VNYLSFSDLRAQTDAKQDFWNAGVRMSKSPEGGRADARSVVPFCYHAYIGIKERV
jgi:hypothetical protein